LPDAYDQMQTKIESKRSNCCSNTVLSKQAKTVFLELRARQVVH